MSQNATVNSKLTQRMLNTIKRGLQSVFGEFLNKKVGVFVMFSSNKTCCL